MPVVQVSDAGDPRLQDYVGLTDVALRSRTEPAQGLYMAESRTVIERALAVGHRPRSFLMTARWLPDLAVLIESAQARFGPIPVYVGEREVVEAITGFHLHRGALAAMHRPSLPDPQALLAAAGVRRVVVCEDIVDHTNVGAILRGAAGLGVDALFVTPRCADPLYRRAVRVSMGAVFDLPWTRLARWPADVRLLKDAGFTIAALTPRTGAVPLDQFAQGLPEKLALVLGTEGAGLSDTTIALADVNVSIPMSGSVDSLNVAAAAAVAFWATRPPQGSAQACCAPQACSTSRARPSTT